MLSKQPNYGWTDRENGGFERLLEEGLLERLLSEFYKEILSWGFKK